MRSRTFTTPSGNSPPALLSHFRTIDYRVGCYRTDEGDQRRVVDCRRDGSQGRHAQQERLRDLLHWQPRYSRSQAAQTEKSKPMSSRCAVRKISAKSREILSWARARTLPDMMARFIFNKFSSTKGQRRNASSALEK